MGLLHAGARRDYYVYAYMPLTRALDTTPKNLLFTLVAYAMVLFIVIMIRWRLKHVYQEDSSAGSRATSSS